MSLYKHLLNIKIKIHIIYPDYIILVKIFLLNFYLFQWKHTNLHAVKNTYGLKSHKIAYHIYNIWQAIKIKLIPNTHNKLIKNSLDFLLILQNKEQRTMTICKLNPTGSLEVSCIWVF